MNSLSIHGLGFFVIFSMWNGSVLLQSENPSRTPSELSYELKHRRSSSNLSAAGSTITESTQAGDLINGSGDGANLPTGVISIDQMDLLVEQVKMLAGEIAFSSSTMKRLALEQKSVLESQIADSDRTVQELEQKMFAAVELLQNYKKERDELQVECDDALRLLQEMKEKEAEEASCSSPSQFYTEFSFSEIKEATRNFDPSLKIGEGGYGSILRCFIRHTEVAIKMLHSHSLQGPTEFQQEVNILSRLRHPNLVTLVGA